MARQQILRSTTGPFSFWSRSLPCGFDRQSSRKDGDLRVTHCLVGRRITRSRRHSGGFFESGEPGSAHSSSLSRSMGGWLMPMLLPELFNLTVEHWLLVTASMTIVALLQSPVGILLTPRHEPYIN